MQASQDKSYTQKHTQWSVFVAAAIAFVILNLVFSFTRPFAFDRYAFPYKNWVWWTVNDLRTKPQVHNVALLGSSLMISSISGCDANYTHKNLDLADYHKAAYLDHRLAEVFGGAFETFNLAAPGQMPSDAYLALKAMVNCGNRPDVVIYGVAPRDFIDSCLTDPADTEPFRYLRRLVDIADIAPNRVFQSPLAKLDCWLQQVVFLNGEAQDMQMAFCNLSERALNVVLPKPYNNPSFTWWDRVRLLPNYMPGELHEGAVIIGPMDQGPPRKFLDNTKEYQARYRSPDPETYRTQMFFLKKMMAFCRKERIELILVNMPITFYNASMLQSGIYGKFIQAMSTVAWENGDTFYNLAEFSLYSIEDFNDSVHMNGLGGRKFVDRLVFHLMADPRATSAMMLAGKELERQQMVANSTRTRTY